MIRKLIGIAAVAALVGGVAGCANNDQMHAQIQDAMQAAQAAQTTANQAKSEAEQAQKSADQAIKGVQQAKAGVQANSKRIDRAFSQSQRK